MNSYNYNFDDSGYEDSTDQYQSRQYGYHEYGTAGGNPSYGEYGYDETDNDPNEESEFAMGEDVGGSVSEVIDDIDFDDPRIANLPRILLMGPRRAGKTSIQRVVFHKMSPHETLFRLEATQNLERSVVDHTQLCRFTIWDFPGDYYGPEHLSSSITDDAISESQGIPSMIRQPPVHAKMNQQNEGFQSSTPDDDNELNDGEIDDVDTQVFGRATALIFVLDAQDEPYDHVLQHFTETVKRAARANPHIAIEVFINKVDGELFLSDEAKYDCRRDVMQQVTDELADAGVMPDSVQISYHLTSIYDHSVFDAFSRVVQKLIPQLPTLENLLNVLVSTCAMEKAFLFDVASKLYISTDSSPVDMQSVELCSDMIDVVLDVSGIYGMSGEAEEGKTDPIKGDLEPLSTVEDGDIKPGDSANKGETVDIHEDDLTQGSHKLAEGKDELVGTLISQGMQDLEDADGKEFEPDTAYDSQSASVIRLTKGMILYLKEVDTMLALVCLIRSDNFRKRNLINFNIGRLKNALRALTNPNA